jgi:exopolysaccharide biosynthesis polyprenyl glycosylphosphotransferase
VAGARGGGGWGRPPPPPGGRKIACASSVLPAVSEMQTRAVPAPFEPGVRVEIQRRHVRRAQPVPRAIPEGQSALGLLRRDARARRALAVVDIFAGIVALLVSGVSRPSGSLKADVLLLAALVLSVHAAGLYHRDEHLLRRTTLEEVPALFRVATLWSLVTWLGAELLLGRDVHAGRLLAGWALLFLVMIIGRSAARWIVRQFNPPERCLVLGDAITAAFMRKKFEISFSTKATVVGRIPRAVEPEPFERRRDDVPVLGVFDRLRDTLVLHGIDRVIVAPDDTQESFEAIRLIKSMGVKISVLPRMFEVVGSAFELDEVDGVTLLGIHRSELTRSSRLVKRAVDVVVSALALTTLAPLIGIIALLIKLDSRGPVLFSQKRIGRHGREFRVHKFRSMVDGADAQKASLMDLNETVGLFKIANDPRVTRMGQLLRSTSLDELPQLWNVLRGEMSLVGPRPLVPDDDAKIRGWERNRLNVTPGMTGAWQILGSTRVPLEEMVKLDYLYGATWSLWLDMKILLRTVAYVAARRSA